MPAATTIALSIYTLVGPFPWLVLWGMMPFGRSRMTRLTRAIREPLPSPAPRVSVVVPAKDEGRAIEACVQRLLALDYPNFEMIAVDDRSTDDTGAVLDSIAARSDPRCRFRALHVDELPPGWLGKCHALHIATQQIDPRSEWILFVDSDVSVEPRALADALSLATQRGYDAVSILTRLECHTFLERLVLPLAAMTWMIAFTASLTNDDNLKHIALANGQFFLIRRHAYESIGAHAAVREQIVEDVELMRRLKLAGHRVRFLIGTHLAATRMHTNARQMRDGWARIFAGTARREAGRLIGAMTFIIVAGWSAYPGLAIGTYLAIARHQPLLLAIAMLHALMLTVFLAIFYRGSGNRGRDALLFPASSAILLSFLAFAVKLCRTGRVDWRGTTIEMKRAS